MCTNAHICVSTRVLVRKARAVWGQNVDAESAVRQRSPVCVLGFPPVSRGCHRHHHRLGACKKGSVSLVVWTQRSEIQVSAGPAASEGSRGVALLPLPLLLLGPPGLAGGEGGGWVPPLLPSSQASFWECLCLPSSPPCVLGHLLSESEPSLNPGRPCPESLKSGCKGPVPNEAIFAGTKGEDADTSFEGPGAENDAAHKRSPVVERRAEVSTAPGAQPQRKGTVPLPVHRASGQTTAAP